MGAPGAGATTSGHGTATVATINNPTNTAGINSMMTQQTNQSNAAGSKPKAFINVIFFDEQFKAVDYRISMVGNNSELKNHYSELQNIVSQKNGYVYIYVSNESPVNVFFDNLQVVHTRGPILEETHYYPFGLTMNGISGKALNGVAENKRKYNGIEYENSFDINFGETFFRTHDPQLGRWWQIDPKPSESLSPYCAMNNNPMFLSDPLGDTTWVYSKKGKLLETLNDKLPNQAHFTSAGWYGVKSIFRSNDINTFASSVRKSSTAFIGNNTLADMTKIKDAAIKDNKEILFTGVVGKDREIRLSAVKTDKGEYAKMGDVDKIIDAAYTKSQQANIFLIGHVHQQAPENSGTLQIGLPGTPLQNLYHYGYPSEPTINSSGDYGPYLYRSAEATTRGQSPALILSRWGFTIYGTASSSKPGTGTDSFTVTDAVQPGTESYYFYKQLKR